MTKKSKNKIIKQQVTKEVMVDETGREDLRSIKGNIFNRPVASIGMAMFLGGPFIGGLTDSTFLGGTFFILGGIIGSYGMSKGL